jgi:hypothetical protein
MHRLFSRARSGRGQGLVEFALILPVLILIVLIALDFGRALYGWVVLQNATRIAANYAAVYPEGWEGAGDPSIQADYEELLENDLDTANCSAPATPPPPQFADGPDTPAGGGSPDTDFDIGDTVVVELSCSFTPLTPIIGGIVGNSVQLAARSEFRIRAGDIIGLPHPTQIPVPCTTVPDLTDNAGNPETVDEARSEWTGSGFIGTFDPANGHDAEIVLTQDIAAGTCAPSYSAITVTYAP